MPSKGLAHAGMYEIWVWEWALLWNLGNFPDGLHLHLVSMGFRPGYWSAWGRLFHL